MAAAALTGAAFAPAAGATTLEVSPGESIQAAVRAARPGDVISVHPGTYEQSVEIRKDDITLRGAGARRSGTVLEPAAETNRCWDGEAGVCILPQGNGSGDLTRTADVRVSGFLISGYDEYGAIAEFARHAVFSHNDFVDDGEYGAAAFRSRRTVMLHNRASGNGEAGFYIGDSRREEAVLRDNIANHNGFGFYLRDASEGVAVDNTGSYNCMGMMLRNSAGGGGVHRWAVARNHFSRNSRYCGGTGIMLLGARGNVIRGNEVLANRQPDPLKLSGGIVLASSASLGGTAAAHNRIIRNRAHRNRRSDIVWDGDGSGNRFHANDCSRSNPPGLCD